MDKKTVVVVLGALLGFCFFITTIFIGEMRNRGMSACAEVEPKDYCECRKEVAPAFWQWTWECRDE